jgi:spermidine/putrescine transport system substrate-binding protein
MLNRRTFLAAASATALAALGCSGDKKGPGPSASASPGAGASGALAAQKPGKDLTLFGWSEYIPEAVIDGFSKETGITVHYETYASNEEMLSKLLAGATTYDLIQPSEYVVEALQKQNKLLPLDPANVPNLRNIASDMRGFPHDPELKYSVPYMAGTVGIVVNSAKIKDPIKGYKDVFQPRYKGRIVVVNDARELVTWALATVGIGPNDVNADALAKAKPILAEWVKLVKVFDSDSPKTALLNGDVDIGVIWSGEAALLYEQDKKFAFTLPEERAHFWIDNMCIPAGAKNKLGAEMFIDYVLRPDVSKKISDKFPYLNPNARARALLTDAQLANPASYPPAWFRTPHSVITGMTDTTKRGETFRDIGKMATEIDKLVTDLKSAN